MRLYACLLLVVACVATGLLTGGDAGAACKCAGEVAAKCAKCSPTGNVWWNGVEWINDCGADFPMGNAPTSGTCTGDTGPCNTSERELICTVITACRPVVLEILNEDGEVTGGSCTVDIDTPPPPGDRETKSWTQCI